MNYGLTILLANPSNPLGTYLKTRFLELGKKQNEVADFLGVKQSAIANVFAVEGTGPSFATQLGGGMTNLMLSEEQNQWRSHWQAGVVFGPRRYPKDRPEVVRKAAFVLSFYNRTTKSSGDDDNRNLEFREIMTMIDEKTYREMLQMIWAPYFGAIIAKPKKGDRIKLVSSHKGYDEDWVKKHSGTLDRLRRATGEDLFKAEQSFGEAEAMRVLRLLNEARRGASTKDILALMSDDERREDKKQIYDAETLSLSLNGRVEEAMRRISSRFCGWEDYQFDQMEEASVAAAEVEKADEAKANGHLN